MRTLLLVSVALLLVLAETSPVFAVKATTSQGQFSTRFDCWQSYSPCNRPAGHSYANRDAREITEPSRLLEAAPFSSNNIYISLAYSLVTDALDIPSSLRQSLRLSSNFSDRAYPSTMPKLSQQRTLIAHLPAVDAVLNAQGLINSSEFPVQITCLDLEGFTYPHC